MQSRQGTSRYPRSYKTPLKSENAHPNISKHTPNSKTNFYRPAPRNPLKTTFNQNSDQKNIQISNSNTTKYSHISTTQRLQPPSNILNSTPRTKFTKEERVSSIKTSKLIYENFSGKKSQREQLNYYHNEYQNQQQSSNHILKQYTSTAQRYITYQSRYDSERKTRKISPLSRTPFKEKNAVIRIESDKKKPIGGTSLLYGQDLLNSAIYNSKKKVPAQAGENLNHSGKKNINYRIFNSKFENIEPNVRTIPCKNYLIHTPPPNLSSSQNINMETKPIQKKTIENYIKNESNFNDKNQIEIHNSNFEYSGHSHQRYEKKNFLIEGESLNNNIVAPEEKNNIFDSLENEGSYDEKNEEEEEDENFIEGLAKISEHSKGVYSSNNQKLNEFGRSVEFEEDKHEGDNFINYKNNFDISETDQDEATNSNNVDGNKTSCTSMITESELINSEESKKNIKNLKKFNSFEIIKSTEQKEVKEPKDTKEKNEETKPIDILTEEEQTNLNQIRESFGPPLPKNSPSKLKNPFKNSNKKQNLEESKVLIQASGSSVGFNEPDYQKVKEDYIDGSTYVGFKLKAKKHGKGTLILRNGSRYEGDWRNDVMSGIGKLFYDSNVLAYEGGFLDNKVEGHGIMHNDLFLSENKEESNNEYKIDYKDLGSVKENWVSFDGSFKGDMKEGIGKWHLSDGSVFVGEFLLDKAHGDGVFYFSGGDVVAGRWEDNVLIEAYN